MTVKKIISDGISYIFTELKEAQNSITKERKQFLLTSLDLYLNGLEHIVNNNKTDKQTEFIDVVNINEDELYNSIVAKQEIYIGASKPMIVLEETKKSLESITSKIKNRLGLTEDDHLPRNVHVLIPMHIIKVPEYKTIKETDSDRLIDIFDKNFNLDLNIQQQGYEYIKDHCIGVVLLAGGGGTRFKNSIEDLHKSPEEPQNKWTIDALKRSGVLEKLDADIAKVVAPMTAIANNSPIQENLESVASIIRDYKPEMPVVIIVGPTTEQVVMDLLKKNNNFGIKNIAIRCQGKLPFINEETVKVIEMGDGVLDGANGGGGTLLALGLAGIKDNNGKVFYEGSTIDWFKSLGVQNILMAQTDDAKDREIYAGFAGVMAKCTKSGKNGMVILGADYPNSYKKIHKNGKETFDADFKIGSLWDFLNNDGEIVKTAIVEYNELNDEQRDIFYKVLKHEHDSRIIGNLGCYMMSMELASSIINDSVLPLHFQFGKKEKIGGDNQFVVTKFEYFMTDVPEIASLMENNIGILMVRNTDNFEGHMKYMTIDSLPLKDVYKLAIAQQSKIIKDKIKSKSLGIEVAEDAVVEFSNLAKFESIGKCVKIEGSTRVLFCGDANSDHSISIGNNVVFKGNGTFIIKSDRKVKIEDNTCFETNDVVNV